MGRGGFVQIRIGIACRAPQTCGPSDQRFIEQFPKP